MHDNLSSFLDPIAKVWGNQQVLLQVVSSPKAKLANKINNKKLRKNLKKKVTKTADFLLI